MGRGTLAVACRSCTTAGCPLAPRAASVWCEGCWRAERSRFLGLSPPKLPAAASLRRQPSFRLAAAPSPRLTVATAVTGAFSAAATGAGRADDSGAARVATTTRSSTTHNINNSTRRRCRSRLRSHSPTSIADASSPAASASASVAVRVATEPEPECASHSDGEDMLLDSDDGEHGAYNNACGGGDAAAADHDLFFESSEDSEILEHALQVFLPAVPATSPASFSSSSPAAAGSVDRGHPHGVAAAPVPDSVALTIRKAAAAAAQAARPLASHAQAPVTVLERPPVAATQQPLQQRQWRLAGSPPVTSPPVARARNKRKQTQGGIFVRGLSAAFAQRGSGGESGHGRGGGGGGGSGHDSGGDQLIVDVRGLAGLAERS